VYALANYEMLFYFDGNHWVRVNLEGIPGDWWNGDCDTSGTSWIVGTWGTHSCMATGWGLQWVTDGCGSYYLYDVCIADDGVGFAVGGDGLWQLAPTGFWIRVQAYGRDLSRWAIGLAADLGVAVVVTWRHPNVRELLKPVTELEIFVGADWQAVPSPFPFIRDQKPQPVAAVLPGRRILLAVGSEIWESTPLRS
jgi:hypothetical protein